MRLVSRETSVLLAFAFLVVVVVILGAALNRAHTSVPQPAPAPVATVSAPTTVIVDGYSYSCAMVRQLVAAGENYTPDGHYIHAVLLADCDI